LEWRVRASSNYSVRAMFGCSAKPSDVSLVQIGDGEHVYLFPLKLFASTGSAGSADGGAGGASGGASSSAEGGAGGASSVGSTATSTSAGRTSSGGSGASSAALPPRLCASNGDLAVPEALKMLLENKSVKKVGVGIKGDAARLKKQYGVIVENVVDLGKLGGTLLKTGNIFSKEFSGRWSLASLTEATLGVELDKTVGGVVDVKTAAWDQWPLSVAERTYAANDAASAFDVHAFMTGAAATAASATRSRGRLSKAKQKKAGGKRKAKRGGVGRCKRRRGGK
jgi:hypothetical protein